MDKIAVGAVRGWSRMDRQNSANICFDLIHGWPMHTFWNQYNSNTIIGKGNFRNTITIQYNQSIFLANTIPIQFQPFKSYFNTIHNTIHTQFQISSDTRRNINMDWNICMTVISRTQHYNLCCHGMRQFIYPEWVLTFWNRKSWKSWKWSKFLFSFLFCFDPFSKSCKLW